MLKRKDFYTRFSGVYQKEQILKLDLKNYDQWAPVEKVYVAKGSVKMVRELYGSLVVENMLCDKFGAEIQSSVHFHCSYGKVKRNLNPCISTLMGSGIHRSLETV